MLNRSKFKRSVHNHVSIRHCVTDRVVGVACHLSPLFGRHNGASPLKRAGRSVIGRRTGFPHARRPGSSPKAAGATSEKLMPPILPNLELSARLYLERFRAASELLLVPARGWRNGGVRYSEGEDRGTRRNGGGRWQERRGERERDRSSRRTIEFVTAVSDGSSQQPSALIFSQFPRRPPRLNPVLRPFSFERFSYDSLSSRLEIPSLLLLLLSSPGEEDRDEGGHYVQLQEAFSRSNSVAWRSFDHDPEERLGSIGNEAVIPGGKFVSLPRKRVHAFLSSFLPSFFPSLSDRHRLCFLPPLFSILFQQSVARPIGNTATPGSFLLCSPSMPSQRHARLSRALSVPPLLKRGGSDR